MSVTMESPGQQRAQVRPRSKSGFSFRSDKSGGGSSSSGHHRKESLSETHEEKRKTHLSITGKANPNAAMTELQPIAAALEKPTLGSLRSMSYNDQFGNPITEPDRSNPTRPRWERPLDTIRSFEAAIDNEYKQRQAILRSEIGTDAGYGGYSYRRSSTYWAGGYDQARPRFSTAGSYSAGQSRDSYAENGYAPSPYAPSPRQRFNLRAQSDATLARFANQQNGGPYGGTGLQESRDTVDTGTTSGSGSEQWANSTDPSSENSSIDRVKASPAKTNGEYEAHHNYPDYPAYGNGNPQFRGPIVEENGYGQNSYGTGPSNPNLNGNGYSSQNPSDGVSPAPPPKMDVPRKVISLNGNQNGGLPQSYGGGPLQTSSGNAGRPMVLQKQPSQKRKSWLRRKFSTKE